MPQPTEVLSYVFLWSHEADRGRDEGSKERPVVVVLSTVVRDGRNEILVAPMTTKAPATNAGAVELPVAVRQHLGLGDDRCWIVTSELNSFVWPGPDLRPVGGGDGSPRYGYIPGRLFEQVRERVLAHVDARTARQVMREE